MPHIEISPKQFQVRIYGRHPDNYVASFQLYVDGDKGFIHSLNGRRFYNLIPEFVRKAYEMCGVRSVEAYVLEAHARLLKRVLQGVLKTEILGPGSVAGRKMLWVRLSLEGVFSKEDAPREREGGSLRMNPMPQVEI